MELGLYESGHVTSFHVINTREHCELVIMTHTSPDACVRPPKEHWELIRLGMSSLSRGAKQERPRKLELQALDYVFQKRIHFILRAPGCII